MKIFISVVLAIALYLLLVAITQAEEYPYPNTKGDVNCDLQVTATDALFELRMIAGERVTIPGDYPNGCLWLADTNCANPYLQATSDVRDPLNILRYVAGLPISQPERCAPVGGVDDYWWPCAPGTWDSEGNKCPDANVGEPWSATPAPEED